MSVLMSFLLRVFPLSPQPVVLVAVVLSHRSQSVVLVADVVVAVPTMALPPPLTLGRPRRHPGTGPASSPSQSQNPCPASAAAARAPSGGRPACSRAPPRRATQAGGICLRPSLPARAAAHADWACRPGRSSWNTCGNSAAAAAVAIVVAAAAAVLKLRLSSIILKYHIYIYIYWGRAAVP